MFPKAILWILVCQRVEVLSQFSVFIHRKLFLTRDIKISQTALPLCEISNLWSIPTLHILTFSSNPVNWSRQKCARNNSATSPWENKRAFSSRSNTPKLRNFWRHRGNWPISTKITLIRESPAVNKSVTQRSFLTKRSPAWRLAWNRAFLSSRDRNRTGLECLLPSSYDWQKIPL